MNDFYLCVSFVMICMSILFWKLLADLIFIFISGSVITICIHRSNRIVPRSKSGTMPGI